MFWFGSLLRVKMMKIKGIADTYDPPLYIYNQGVVYCIIY